MHINVLWMKIEPAVLSSGFSSSSFNPPSRVCQSGPLMSAHKTLLPFILPVPFDQMCLLKLPDDLLLLRLFRFQFSFISFHHIGPGTSGQVKSTLLMVISVKLGFIILSFTCFCFGQSVHVGGSSERRRPGCSPKGKNFPPSC